MRSKMIIVATVVASLLFVPLMASADQVQEQLRLMEQRMAEMEDRLQATSVELQTAKATVDEQQGLLSEAGLIEEGDDGIRSSVGNFLEQVDISGVAAASYTHRFKGPGDANNDIVGDFRHPNGNTFAIDQFWLTLDKAPTEDDRAGMHVELISGVSADAQLGDGNNSLGLYTAYASYLMPVAGGVQIDVGKLATPLGAEVLQTNKNMNVSQGLVWGFQPVVHTGIAASGSIHDNFGWTFGIVNDVYNEGSVDDSRDKAYFGQVSYNTDMFGISAGAIVGKDSSSGYQTPNGGGGDCRSGDECKTSVFNVVATANPTDNVSVWADFTWVKAFGDDMEHKGDVHGIAVAGRVGITDTIGIAARGEYVRGDSNYSRATNASDLGIMEVASLTLTGDVALTDCLKFRPEVRYDWNLSNGPLFAIGSNNTTGGGGNMEGTRNKQLFAIAELAYEF